METKTIYNHDSHKKKNIIIYSIYTTKNCFYTFSEVLTLSMHYPKTILAYFAIWRNAIICRTNNRFFFQTKSWEIWITEKLNITTLIFGLHFPPWQIAILRKIFPFFPSSVNNYLKNLIYVLVNFCITNFINFIDKLNHRAKCNIRLNSFIKY